ncbi:hypothetical protein AB0G54_36795 [Streptomyces yokosukanensis]|uniref:hypothetical protein n=1 Tax=Streptomyces yokosukanensis TaxID=67386 RepID=UPI0034321D48
MALTPSPVRFITGCSTGLGRAPATAALEHGHRAVVTARDPRTITDVAAVEEGEDIVEPAAFRTNWSGPSMRQSAIHLDDYATTAGARRAGTPATYGHQPGDPVRAAAAIIRTVEAEESLPCACCWASSPSMP